MLLYNRLLDYVMLYNHHIIMNNTMLIVYVIVLVMKMTRQELLDIWDERVKYRVLDDDSMISNYKPVYDNNILKFKDDS